MVEHGRAVTRQPPNIISPSRSRYRPVAGGWPAPVVSHARCEFASNEEREQLEALIRKGKSAAQRLLKARILLKADVSEAGEGWSDNRIIKALETSASMVYRVRKQLVEEGFEAVLSRKQRATPAVARIFDGEKEAKLIALACSKPPKGRARWTLRLLEKKVVELQIVDRASDSTIGRALKKTFSSPIASSAGSSRRRPMARS